ncbi:MAG: hypothetical protein H7836_17615 [Magnetococcus sp. YQC-3]
MRHPSPLTRLITLTSGIIAGMIFLLPPIIHLFLSWHHINEQLHTELRIIDYAWDLLRLAMSRASRHLMKQQTFDAGREGCYW